MIKFRVSGRPKKYQTAEQLIKRINAYFDLCDKENAPYTENGLGLFIGLDRAQLRTYKQSKTFYPIIKQALQIITEKLERMTLTHGNSAGPIFLLKNQGYSDTHQHLLAGHDGKELKWKIEVVRGKDTSGNRPRLPLGGCGKPRLIADNTAINPDSIDNTEPDLYLSKTRNESPKLLPGVTNFSEAFKAN